MARVKAKPTVEVTDLRHDEATRTNNPPAGLASEGQVPILPKVEYSYGPRRTPELRFDPAGKGDELPELIAQAMKRPLTADEAKNLADALRNHEPWLEWAAKLETERQGLSVDPVALHIHERLSTR